MIIAGVDVNGPALLTTDPSGSYRGYKARALGRNAEQANQLLDDKYVDGLSLDEAIKLSIEAVNVASGGDLEAVGVKVVVIPAETKTMKRLSEDVVAKYM
jgi:20S proteasome alpha/beta subunit